MTRSDAAIGALLDAAGGPDEFLERYAVVLCSDHGQTHVDRHVRLETSFGDLDDVLVTASNRAGMVYRLGDRAPDTRSLAERLDGEESAETVLFLEGSDAIARRDGEELRFAPDAGAWTMSGDEDLLGYPGGFERAWAALDGFSPNRSRVQEAFERQVVADAPQQIERKVGELIDWMIDADLRHWQGIMPTSPSAVSSTRDS